MQDPDGIDIYYTPGEVNCLGDVLKRVKVKGDVVEVGVYKGGSAKVIAKHFKDQKVYLFDTFNGFPNDIDFKERSEHSHRQEEPEEV